MRREGASREGGGAGGGGETWEEVAFYYKGTPLEVVEQFVYLGVLCDWMSDACVAAKAREEAGGMAFGAVKAQLVPAPFLPWAQMVTVAEAVTGGAG